jgi:hypothetical protein
LFVRPQATFEWSTRKVPHLGKLLALPTKISIGWKRLSELNTLAYYENLYITDVKSFITLGPGHTGHNYHHHYHYDNYYYYHHYHYYHPAPSPALH